jgi:hypothetical protein
MSQAVSNRSDAIAVDVIMQTRRFASEDVAQVYPYPVADNLHWESEGDRHRCEFLLPAMPADTIVVPSFSCIDDADYAFVFSLHNGEHCWQLSAVGPIETTTECGPAATVSTPIDNFHVHAPLSECRLVLTVKSPRAPKRYLATIAARPFTTTAAVGSEQATRLAVSPLSQLTAPRGIRRRICSPTCLTMVLRHFGVTTNMREVSAGCFHEPSKMYGVWPLATWTASRHGVIGATELFEGLDEIAPALRAGFPPVASIRFHDNKLTDAPMRATGGHLVVVTGLDAQRVWTNDPAARDLRDVPRGYKRDEFAAAWFTERGATYIFAPPSSRSGRD